MDVRVKEVQEWLGETFPSYFYYDESGGNSGSYPVKPDGKTGNTTVKALIMALQIHLGLNPVDGVWGNGTSSKCPTLSRTTNDLVLVKIAQGGFLCKGYNPGALDGKFGNSTANVVKSFKADLGFPDGSESLNATYFKSLLTTDPTKETISTNSYIRMAQQYLNYHYSSLYQTKLGFIPTSGQYERKTSKALIYALQKEIGTTTDGALGTNTFAKMPILTRGSLAAAQVKVLQCALICNKFYVENINGNYDQSVMDKVSEFQEFMCLNLDPNVTLGSVNRRTWGALLWSKGDTERIPNAADTRYQLTAVQAQSLYKDGIQYIGRYLTKVDGGFDKNLTLQEISNITKAGLKIFPLFQENNTKAEHFSYESGYDNGLKGIKAAIELRIPSSVLYFCVDFDATEEQAETVVKQYFEGINAAKKIMNSSYRIGIYSARNTCDVICKAELAVHSFVSNMSTGYSGNLGFLMPENWSFDQYGTMKYVADDNSTFDLDKVIASGRDVGVGTIDDSGDDNWSLHTLNWDAIDAAVKNAELITSVIPKITNLENIYWECFPKAQPMDCALSVLYFLWHLKYTDLQFNVTLVTNPMFESYILEKHASVLTQLEPYIKKEGYKILKDSSDRLMELHHLAAVISAYLEPPSPIPAEWYSWAGDLATAFKEIYLLKDSPNFAGYPAHARDRIGRMDSSADPVQMNYCDIFGDADGFGICTIMKQILNKSVSHEHLLSDAMYQYYGSHYKKRMTYLLSNMHISNYNVAGIASGLYEYATDDAQWLLRKTKAKIDDVNIEYSSIIHACCDALAEFIVHFMNLDQ